VVQNLEGGPPISGTLVDIGAQGALLSLARHVAVGEAVRLEFPRGSGEPSGRGRTMIGSVVHARGESGGAVVGVAFGWHTAVGPRSLRFDRESAPSSWLSRLLRRIGVRRAAVASASG
jgi:hypothetical protein